MTFVQADGKPGLDHFKDEQRGRAQELGTKTAEGVGCGSTSLRAAPAPPAPPAPALHLWDYIEYLMAQQDDAPDFFGTTFSVEDEDHTLANSLRFFLNKK